MDREGKFLSLVNTYKEAFIKIEETKEFHSIDKRISGIFYTLYSRCKRLYYAMMVLNECDDKNVSTPEMLPLLRVYLEGYFHFSFVISEKDVDFIKKGYENLSYYSGKLIANKLKHSKQLGEDGKQFVSNFDLGYKLPKEYEFLDDISKLSDKTGKKDLYRKYYTPLNSFIHFNPATFINYGQFKDDKFVYNVENDSDKQMVLKIVNELLYLFIAEVVDYLNNDTLNEEISKLLRKNTEEIFN